MLPDISPSYIWKIIGFIALLRAIEFFKNKYFDSTLLDILMLGLVIYAFYWAIKKY